MTARSLPYPAPPKEPVPSPFGTVADPVRNALAEDIGPQDLTSSFYLPTGMTVEGRIFAKQQAVLAGVECAMQAFRLVDPGIQVNTEAQDGVALETGTTVLTLNGPARSILTAERVALNFLQRLSGVATLTNRFVRAIEGSRASIVDTRKTTPGLRALEKAAVVAGGGKNHRHGLYDAVMLKDNHIAALGGLESLAERIRDFSATHPGVLVEAEADTLEQVEALARIPQIKVILLDNMTPDRIAKALTFRREELWFEASGGVNLETVRSIAETGVDFISVGALTHSALAIDLSLELSSSP